MHPNPVFHTQSDNRNIAFARERAFGVLAVNGDGGPLLSHVPFLVDETGVSLDLHLVRSNPIARALSVPLKARIAVSGPDGYVSPDWYEVPDQVPTWNYVAVHLTGTLERLPQDQMRDMLDRQSKHFEAQLAPKPEWKTDKMMRQIVPCRMRIEGVDGTWKLNQNKPDEVRLRAADQMDAFGMGMETRMLAGLMRGAGGQGGADR